jgi:two-component system, OmpR family, sensor histidine kinase MprB
VSLRRRIAAAAAVAVAAVAVAVALTGYFTTRSHLLGEVKTELWARARPELQPHRGERGPRPEGQHGNQSDFGAPPNQPFGGAQGYFQVLHPDGTVSLLPNETIQLPVDARAVQVARTARGSFFTDVTVSGHHLEMLTVGDASDHWAIQVALPLNDVDAVLHGLLLPYIVLIAGGIVLAALLGLAISRSALRPIERFVARTERVTSELEHPARLEETDTVELRRLAKSFNQTIDALERSIEAQRHLVADASHELRTPIAALRSNIQIFLEAERLPVGEREELQESILAELDELTQIVADVMELARGAAPELNAEPIELDTIVREAVDRAQRRAPSLRFNLELEATIVRGVPERVGRAVANVVDNARKWSPPDGEIDVRLRDGVLYVRDHGPGFGEADLHHVFDRFYRATRARRMPGSGLGLAIVKQAAEAHGGHAEAANAPDGGAVVTVSFGPPLERDVSPEANATGAQVR